MQGARWGHAGHTRPADRTELNLRHVEGDGGRLETGLHDFQRTSQNGSYRPPTSGETKEEAEVRWIVGVISTHLLRSNLADGVGGILKIPGT